MSETLEWKKFSEPPDPSIQVIWITDLESVWILKGKDWENYLPEENWLWAKSDVVFPDVPNKKRHECSKESGCGTFVCYYVGDDLFLEHDMGAVQVSYCPFCGYKGAEK
jgi:hypothetical protein